MRCFIDTNILISAGLFPNSVPALALKKALTPPNTAIICDYSLGEFRHVVDAKFPDKRETFETFLSRLLPYVAFVRTPDAELSDEEKISDVKDRPLLRAAVLAKADILLTGDKGFLESAITVPKIVTAAEFIRQ